MAKITTLGRDLSLRKSLVLYILLFTLLALVLIAGTFALSDWEINAIQQAYPADWERYYLTTESGERLGEGALIGVDSIPMTEKDQRWLCFWETLPAITAPLYSAACILAAGLLFYRNKLKGPLGELRRASENIARNDLDFTVAWESWDELGELCRSFERMRAALAQNVSTMWRQMEERRRLNAAFAHDLRTPLTVLKGYNEMLCSSAEGEERRTAQTMGRHIDRIQGYIGSMSNLCRLEDLEPSCVPSELSALTTALAEDGEALCREQGRSLHVKNQTQGRCLSVDPQFVIQVGNNLLSNAVRYAHSGVTLEVSEEERGLVLSVSDDGPGFSPKGLEEADAPYFTEGENGHFGLGLYICKLLCQRHGGWLKLENLAAGACVTAYFSAGEWIKS